MAPSEIPMEGVTTDDVLNGVGNGILDGSTTSALTSAGIVHNLAKTAPSQIASSSQSALPELDASRLVYQFTTSPRAVPHPDDTCRLEQKTCTDHMITCQWTSQTGWGAPKLSPFGPLQLMPTASVLHYATECFEGLKLYRGHDGLLRLFRPLLNCHRFLMSSTRIALPGFDPVQALNLIVELCARDGPKWLPKEHPGTFLYVRPTMIANDPALGVQKPKEALFFVLLACFASMDAQPGGLKLLASDDDMVRAWPGGFGYAKVGANYGPSLVAQAEARKRGYGQILWLMGEEHRVTEAGAANFFVVWRTKEGRVQLVTAPLTDRIILDGVTRRSVLELARERLAGGLVREEEEGGQLEAVEVVERHYTMVEVAEAYREGRLLEAFTAGTAFFVSPVGLVTWREYDMALPILKEGYTLQIKKWLGDIMYGNEVHEWAYVVKEKDVPS